MTLGDFFVTISAKGVEAAKQAIVQTETALVKADKAGTAMGKNVSAAGRVATSAVSGLGTVAGNVAVKMNQLFAAALPGAMKLAASMAAGYGNATKEVVQHVSWVNKTKDSMLSLKDKAIEYGATIRSHLTGAFVGASAAVLGFATAGIAGTVQGERLAWSFRQMALSIGSLFIPVMKTAITLMGDIRKWVDGLSVAQAKSILQWSGMAGGIALVASGVGTIPGLLLIATSAMSMMGKTGASAFESIKTAIGAMVEALFKAWDVIKYVTLGMEALLIGTSKYLAALKLTAGLLAADAFINTGKKAWNKFKQQGAEGEGDKKERLTPTQGGFESVSRTYERIAESTINRFDPQKAADENKKAIETGNGVLDEILDVITESARFHLAGRVPTLQGTS